MPKKIKATIRHLKTARLIYEAKGQSAVFDYANKHKIGYEFCKGCECESPSVKHTCLVCGQRTSDKDK